jgi:hypothetical protein
MELLPAQNVCGCDGKACIEASDKFWSPTASLANRAHLSKMDCKLLLESIDMMYVSLYGSVELKWSAGHPALGKKTDLGVAG